MRFKNNTYAFYDDYFGSTAKTGIFYTVSNIAYNQGPYSEGLYGEMRIALSNKVTHYERRIYSIFELFGDIGGANQIVMILIGYSLTIYSSKLYEFESVSEFYSNSPNACNGPNSISDANNKKPVIVNKRLFQHPKVDIQSVNMKSVNFYGNKNLMSYSKNLQSNLNSKDEVFAYTPIVNQRNTTYLNSDINLNQNKNN